tara:strand:- start:4069 stop:4185 length:117 start_codon:yes stop_codon:yes gene_type:complete
MVDVGVFVGVTSAVTDGVIDAVGVLVAVTDGVTVEVGV